MADEPLQTDPESLARHEPPAKSGSQAGAGARPDGEPDRARVIAVESRSPRMSRALWIGLIYLAICLIAGVLLLLYSLRSVVTDLGNSSP